MAIYKEPTVSYEEKVPVLILSIGLGGIATSKIKPHIQKTLDYLKEFSTFEDLDIIVVPDFTGCGTSYELREVSCFFEEDEKE